MRYGSVCSGVEAATVAWRPLGWECAFVAETEPFASAVLKERLPEVPNLGDFTKITEGLYEGEIDLLVGGTPCQSFSNGGAKGGIADPRGNLALEFARLAERTHCHWVVWENVPAVLAINGGRDFAAILSEFAGWDVQTPAGGWRNAGIVTGAPGRLGVSWRVLDARYTRVPSFPGAVPQRRRRVVLVGHRGDWTRAAEALLGGELCGGSAPPRREAGVFASENAGGCASGECFPIDMMNLERRRAGIRAKCYDEAGAAMYTLRAGAGRVRNAHGPSPRLDGHPLEREAARAGRVPPQGVRQLDVRQRDALGRREDSRRRGGKGVWRVWISQGSRR